MDHERRIAELEALLDHYRGECDRCGRTGVLLDYIPEYDGMESICLQDTDECERLRGERARREGEAFRARVAAGEPLAVMADHFGRAMLDLSRKHVAFKPGTTVRFATSNLAPSAEG
jgi:hypothetical protein